MRVKKRSMRDNKPSLCSSKTNYKWIVAELLTAFAYSRNRATKIIRSR